MTTEQAKLDTPCRAYEAMVPAWDKVDDLMGGTDRMRSVALESRSWLPMMERETGAEYGKRVARSFLEPGLEDAISKAVAKPFSRHVIVTGVEVLPPIVEDIETDADYAGRTLHKFLRDWFQDAVEHGMSHCLVEYPSNTERKVGGGRRPYLTHYPARSVFAWRSERDNDTGEEVLTHVRLKESATVPDGTWGEKEVERIRVLDHLPGSAPTFVLYEKQRSATSEDWVQIDEGTLDVVGIPLVTLYTNRTGFMQASPPLEKLADLNLEHWQSSSDQKNILHTARVPLLAEIGAEADDQDDKPAIEVGANRRLLIPMGGDAKYVEHSGKAIEAGRKDLESIEERMANVGHQMYVARSANVTATGERIDEAKSTSQLREWIAAAAGAAREALEWAARWESVGRANRVALPEELSVEIHSDFAVAAAAEDMPHLITLYQAGVITHATLLHEAKRRNLLLPSLNVELEIEEIEQQGPPLGTIGEDDDEQDDDAAAA